jgi:hypothetical protein
MIRALAFDGYRGFPCRRQYDRSQPFQTLDLAPLTLLIGRNNAGKTSVATLLYQVLGGLAEQKGVRLGACCAGLRTGTGGSFSNRTSCILSMTP